jgi:hypothetical protein
MHCKHPPHDDCQSCAHGKQTRAPYLAVVRTTLAPLDVIRTDTAGPLPCSHDNAGYLQLIHDRASRYLHTVPLVKKSPPHCRNTSCHRHASTQHRPHRPSIPCRKCARTTRGTSTLVLAQPRGRNDIDNTTYKSKNAQAERAIRTIFNATRSALAHSKLGNSFWTYAAADATRKHNTFPTTQDGVTSSPHERLFGTTFATDNLLPFGHRGFVLSTGIKTKLDYL